MKRQKHIFVWVICGLVLVAALAAGITWAVRRDRAMHAALRELQAQNLADSVFRTQPLMRIARTDGSGHFVIKGVASGKYRVYALQDADGDYKFSQKSEMIAFSHNTYEPSAGPDVRQDTIWRDSLHIDNILQVPYTHFYPDDIVLLAFQEVQSNRYLLKTERENADRIGIYFSYGSEQLPVIKGLDFDADSAFVLETSLKKDTLTYWLRDTTLINRDTLTYSMEYLMTDTLGNLVSQTDTIESFAKTSYEKRIKAKQKEYDDWKKEQDKRKKREEPYDSIYPVKPLDVRFNIPSSMTPTSIITIEMPSPLEKLDTSAIHLYSKIDTLWYRAPFEFRHEDKRLRFYKLWADWRPDTEYSLEVDSAAFVDIYGVVSDPIKQGLQVKSLDDFASLTFQLTGIYETNIVVQLLDKSDNCVQQVRAVGGEASFFYLAPNIYYARAFVDRNGNGVWDTGDYDADQQAEAVYYYPNEVECKAKWDATLSWNMTERPLNRQKPSAIMQTKADKEKKKKQNRNAKRAEQLGIEYVKKVKK